MDVNSLGDRGGSSCHSKAAINGSIVTAGALNIANNVLFSLDGVFNVLAAVNNQAFSSGHTTLAAGCACVFAIWTTLAGVVSTTQGSIVDTASLSSGTGKKVIPLPDMQSGKTLIGLVKVSTAGAATFVPGTTNCNATNVTCTFYDCQKMPTVPFTS